jgi:hypothetical protein
LSLFRVFRVFRGEFSGDLLVTTREPRNPLYLLLLLASLLFVVTALAYAVVPTLEQKARDAGQPPPPSEFRDALRQDGWRWLLYEVVAVVALSIASMAVDHLRGLQKSQGDVTIPPMEKENPSS